jgi:hypothetical protein
LLGTTGTIDRCCTSNCCQNWQWGRTIGAEETCCLSRSQPLEDG